MGSKMKQIYNTLYNLDYKKLQIYEPIDLFIVDPAYGKVISSKYDQLSTKEIVKNYWDILEWSSYCAEPGTSMYLFGGTGKYKNRPFFKILSELEHKTDWRIQNIITWKKKRGVGAKYNYLYTREEVVFLIYDAKKPNIFNIPYTDEKRSEAWLKRLSKQENKPKSEYIRRSNVWVDINEIFRGLLVKAQKPEKLIDVIIQTSSNEGSLVCDPMMGSGTSAVCCKRLNRSFIGIEIDTECFEISKNRLCDSCHETCLKRGIR